MEIVIAIIGVTVVLALSNTLIFIIAYKLGKDERITVPMPSMPDWIAELAELKDLLPQKRKPPDEDDLNPMWQ